MCGRGGVLRVGEVWEIWVRYLLRPKTPDPIPLPYRSTIETILVGSQVEINILRKNRLRRLVGAIYGACSLNWKVPGPRFERGQRWRKTA